MIQPEMRIDPEQSSYRECGQQNTFTHDGGVVVLPVASRLPAHRLIRLHGGVAMRRTKWHLERAGTPPMIPAATNTVGDRLLSTIVRPELPTPNNDKTGYDWRVSGEYVFVQNSPRVPGQNSFPVGFYPYIAVPQARAAADLIGNQSPGASLDATVEQAVARVDVDINGFTSWPILALPAACSSTHIIGG